MHVLCLLYFDFFIAVVISKTISCTFEAENGIVELKKDEKKDYFDGTFIRMYQSYYVYAFTTTLQAPDAALHNFKVPLVQCWTDSILPTTQNVLKWICVIANEDLCAVSNEELIKLKRQMVGLFSMRGDDVLLPAAKQIKQEIESEV